MAGQHLAQEHERQDQNEQTGDQQQRLVRAGSRTGRGRRPADPDTGGGWYDNQGNEIGDLAEGQFGTLGGS